MRLEALCGLLGALGCLVVGLRLCSIRVVRIVVLVSGEIVILYRTELS